MRILIDRNGMIRAFKAHKYQKLFYFYELTMDSKGEKTACIDYNRNRNFSVTPFVIKLQKV
jgi:hypothetical protein